MILVAKNLHKKYKKLEVLKDVSLAVEKGSFITIVGPSGAGKSTLLQMISGLESPDKGSIVFDNEEIGSLQADKLAKVRNQHFGFVFQFHHLLPEFTAVENVAMPLLIAKMDQKLANAKAAKVLERVGLQHRLEHKPTEMSGGEQQRVAIARALVNDPEIVFADEPTGNLDSQNALAIHELFLSLQREHNQTLIVVTHNEQLAALGDYCYHMKDGQIDNIVTNRK